VSRGIEVKKYRGKVVPVPMRPSAVEEQMTGQKNSCFSAGANRTCRILIADDSAAVRAQVRSLLDDRRDLEVCGEAVNGAEAIDRTKALQPDLVILDISMPVVDGFEAARVIHKFFPDVRILIFSVHKSNQLMKEALDIGAVGFVSKSEGRQLLKAIDTVLRDGHYSGSTAAYA
jgi:two-component system nitrate/nitrite response regulator NarL